MSTTDLIARTFFFLDPNFSTPKSRERDPQDMISRACPGS